MMYKPIVAQSRFDEIIPPLPREAQLPESFGKDACPWLDDYINFSRTWSPRSFDLFHGATGIWLLSVVCARRVSYDFGRIRFPNLYIALVGRTSVYAKTSAAEIGTTTLEHAGLDFLLLPDTSTPSKMIKDMAFRLPDDYADMSAEQKELTLLKLATAGQRGWFYDEFGMQINGMMRTDGVMADFRGILRKLDDNPTKYSNATIARGLDLVERPYLSLLVSLTPSDLVPYANRGSALWGDGFLARFALIAPPSQAFGEGRFPYERRVIPASLLQPLQNWHARLGLPKIEVTEHLGTFSAQVSPRPPHHLQLTRETYEAYYRYENALRLMIVESEISDLDGNISRFSEKALRMAALFASFEGCNEIQIHHWGKAQQISEGWRASLYELYDQVTKTSSSQPKFSKITDKEKVLRVIDRKRNPTKREIEQQTGLSSLTVANILDELMDVGVIEPVELGRTVNYMRSNEVNRTYVESVEV